MIVISSKVELLTHNWLNGLINLPKNNNKISPKNLRVCAGLEESSNPIESDCQPKNPIFNPISVKSPQHASQSLEVFLCDKNQLMPLQKRW